MTETENSKGQQSVYLEDKDKVVSYSPDMKDEDIAFHVGVNEYGKSPRNALLEAIATNPVVSKGLDFATKVMPIEDWDKLGEGATDTAKAIPKFIFNAIGSSSKAVMGENRAQEERAIAESGAIIGQEVFKSIARVYEPVRPVIGGIVTKKPAGEIAQGAIKSFFKPEDTQTIVSETIPMTDWEREGSAARLIPRAVGEAIESVLLYSNFMKKVPELLNNYKVNETRAGLNNLAEELKTKLINNGYSEEESIRILLDPRTQSFIRETPIFKNITGQGITKFYGGIPLPEFKPGDMLKLGSDMAQVLKVDGARVTLSIAGKEVIRSMDEIAKNIKPLDIQSSNKEAKGGVQKEEAGKEVSNQGKGFKWQPRGFIESIQEEIPYLKVSGQYVPRSTDRLAIKARTLIKEDLPMAEKMALEGTDDAAIATGAELLKYYSEQAGLLPDGAVKDAVYEKAAELGNDMARRLTELGRSVQAASILSRLTPEGQIRFAAKTIQKYNQEVEESKGGLLGWKKKIPELSEAQIKEIIDRMKEIIDMSEGEAKAIRFQDMQNYISDLVPTPLYDKIVAIWKAGLLTGIKTTGVNVLANFSHAFGTEIMKDIPAVTVDSVAALFTKKRSVAFTIKGIGKGTKEGFTKGIRFLKTGYDERQPLDKYDYKRVSFGKGKVAKALQVYEETIFHILGAEDQPFYYGAKARSLYDQAKAQAINKGLKGEEADKFIDDLVANPTEEMLVYAVSDAETAVFQNRTALSTAAGNLKKVTGAEFILPFSKTPSAVAMQIINYTPFGNILTIFRNAGKGKFDQRDFSQGMGRGFVGIAILALGAYLFRKGLMVLDKPTTESEKKLWEIEGKKANTVKIGNQYKSVQVLGPAGNLLLIGGQFQNAFNKSGSFSEAMGRATWGSVKAFTEQTYLTGVSQAIGAITEPEKQGEYFAGSLISSVVPTLVADIARGTDEKVRRPETITQRLMERVPYLRQSLEPRVDTMGREIMRKENFFQTLTDPTRPATAIDEPITQEIRRLVDAGQGINISQVGNKEGYKILTQKQNTELWQRSGQIAYDKIASLMSMSAYAEATDDLKAGEINKIFDKAKLIARVEKVVEITQGLQGEELKAKLSEAKKDGLLNREVLNLYFRFR